MSDDKDLKLEAGLRQAYTDLSTETTPAELDEKIIAAAQPSAGLSNLLSLKPLSWAAITVLAVGLVLELQRSTPEISTEEVTTTQEIPTAIDGEPASAGNAAFTRSAEAPGNDTATLDFRAEQAIAEPRNRSLQQVREKAAVSETLDRVPVAPAAQLYEDLDDLQIAPEPERFCEDIELVDASSWYACVLRLREEGRVDEAAFELSLLRSKFPEFETR